MTVVGIDGNNMYPIAFAIVEGELKETLSWFLTLLYEDLEISHNPFAWTFIYDKQKGLIPVFDETIPDVIGSATSTKSSSSFVNKQIVIILLVVYSSCLC